MLCLWEAMSGTRYAVPGCVCEQGGCERCCVCQDVLCACACVPCQQRACVAGMYCHAMGNALLFSFAEDRPLAALRALHAWCVELPGPDSPCCPKRAGMGSTTMLQGAASRGWAGLDCILQPQNRVLISQGLTVSPMQLVCSWPCSSACSGAAILVWPGLGI